VVVSSKGVYTLGSSFKQLHDYEVQRNDIFRFTYKNQRAKSVAAGASPHRVQIDRLEIFGTLHRCSAVQHRVAPRVGDTLHQWEAAFKLFLGRLLLACFGIIETVSHCCAW